MTSTNSDMFSYGLGLTRANTCVTHRYEKYTDTRNVSGQNDGCRTPAARVASTVRSPSPIIGDRSSTHATRRVEHVLSCFGVAALTTHSVPHTPFHSLLALLCVRVAQKQTTPRCKSTLLTDIVDILANAAPKLHAPGFCKLALLLILARGIQ